MFMITPGTSIPKPQQARSRRSLRQIYAATSRLLEEKSFDQLTVKEIAESSKVSVGSVYQRFGNKDALLLSLHDHYVSECEERIESIENDLPDDRLEERVTSLVRFAMELFSQWHGVIRSIHLRQLSGISPIANSDLGRIKSVYARMVRALVGPDASLIDSCNARLGLSLILAMCRQRYVLEDRTNELCFYENEDQFFSRLVMATIAVCSAGADS